MRLRVLVGLLGVVLAAAGCTVGEPDDEGDGRPLVLTTFTVLADMARVVAGDDLRVESLTTPGAEIHGYEPTPEDLRRAQGADLLVENGLGLEAWFEQFTDDLDVPTATVSEGIEPIPIASAEYAGRDNPHAWMSPANGAVYAENLARAFGDLDPDHADAYRERAAGYAAELDGIQVELESELAAIPEARRALVTCEGAFSYLARDAGLAEAYVWPVNAEQQATPQRVAEAIAFVREREVPAVFCESTVSDEAMQQVAREAGSRVAGTLYVDSLSEADGPVPTYVDLLRHDVDTVLGGLTEGAP